MTVDPKKGKEKVRNMDSSSLGAPDGTVWIALFSLAWFALGLLVGQRFPKPQRKARSQRRPRKEGASPRKRIEIYVGNLPYDLSESEVAKLFQRYGKVAGTRLIENKANGKSKGYGFVEMTDRDEAAEAIKALNGKDIKGRALVVNEAKSRPKN